MGGANIIQLHFRLSGENCAKRHQVLCVIILLEHLLTTLFRSVLFLVS